MDPSASVREQVAISLRHAQGADARATLLQLAGDPNAAVSAAALQILKDRKLSSLELSGLAERVTSGTTDPTLDSLLVTLLSSQELEGAAPTKLLSFLLHRNAGNGLLQARIRSLLVPGSQNGLAGQGG